MITAERITHRAIPVDAGQIEGWKDIPIKESSLPEPLVPLGPLSQEASSVITSATYFGEHTSSPYAKPQHKLEGSLLTLFTRRSTAQRLLVAERLLPPGYHLIVFDAYRPYRVQKSLHDFYKQKLKEQHPYASNEALEAETQQYVSLPSADRSRPSPHNTGGVVDVAIVRFAPIHEEELQILRARLADSSITSAKRASLEMQLSALLRHANMLDFGTAFDHGGKKAALAYYESRIAAGETLTSNDRRACNNRRLLYNTMIRAGFQPYFAEWWHFDAPETQWGAAADGREQAAFGPAELSKSNMAHEAMRRAVHTRTKTANWPTEIIAPQLTQELL